MDEKMVKQEPVKIILSFSLTILVGNLFQQIYNMVDAMIVGQILGVNALAGVGSTGSINFLVLGFVIGLTMGFGIPIAQFIGAKDQKNVQRCIANSVYLAIVISVILTVITVAVTPWMLRVMQTPEDIYADAYGYIVVLLGGLSAAMFYNLLASISRAMGDAKTPLIFLVIASIINAILDYLLVKYTGLGTSGAAYATVAAQMLASIAFVIYLYKKYPILRMSRNERRINTAIIWRLLGVGIPMALQFSVTAVGTIIVQTAINSLGAVVVASVTAANRIQGVLAQPLEALGLTMATFCGQNYGAGRIDRVKKGVLQSLALVVLFSLAAFLIMYFWGNNLTLLFIDKGSSELLSYSRRFLLINGAFFWAVGLLLVLRNAIQGLGYAAAAILAGVFETVGRILVCLVLVGKFGFLAVCYGNPAAWILADVLLVVVYIWVIRKKGNAPSSD